MKRPTTGNTASPSDPGARLRVRLFAVARDRIGAEEIAVEASAVQTVGELRKAIAAAYPQLAPLLPFATFAVDADYADDAYRLEAGREIALIPPVSGG